jgi:hypothetical protein
MVIDEDVVREYRNLFMTWTSIEHELQCERVGYEEDFIQEDSLSDLDCIITSYLRNHSLVDRRFTEGYLRSQIYPQHRSADLQSECTGYDSCRWDFQR